MTKSITKYQAEKSEQILADAIANLEKELSLAKALKESISEGSGIKEKKKVIRLIKSMEDNLISTKNLSLHFRDIEAEEDAASHPAPSAGESSLTWFSEKAIMFSMPPMRSFRKTRDELSGLGKEMAARAEELITELIRSGKMFSAERPVVQFTHFISEDNVKKKYIPDGDNLDCSHFLDVLLAEKIIAEDNVLQVTVVHKGRISNIEKTLIFVYEEGFESDFNPEKNPPISKLRVFKMAH